MNFCFTNKGILMQLPKEAGGFPLNIKRRASFSADEWKQLNAAEELWLNELLAYDEASDTYLLTPEAYYCADPELAELLMLPKQNAKLGISENGNLGSRNYSIMWFPIINGKGAGRTLLRGNYIQYLGREAILTQEQYRLVTAIENGALGGSVEDRARFHAEITALAERADAQIDSFTSKREFIFTDEADYEIESSDPQHVNIKPIVAGLSKEQQGALPSMLKGTTRFNSGNRTTTLFASPSARERYNEISELPELTGTDVPKFLENPFAYIPETVEFDMNLFSERVKGLKIRRSRVAPFISITPSEDKPGWLNIDTGFNVEAEGEQSEEELELPPIEITPELKEMMYAAAAAGEKYIFHQNQWLKIDPDMVSEFAEAEEKREKEFGDSIPADKVKYILDIYENLEGIEYNEALVEEKLNSIGDILCYDIPDCFNGKLYDYQHEGYRFLRSHHESKTGVLLADDMGLGKTIQIISFLSYLFSEDKLATALLVMPKSLLDNWKSEFEKFLPAERKIYIHQGAQRYRSVEAIKQYDVVLTTYETLARDQTMLGMIKWSCVICDEVQKIKNFKTVASAAVKGMNTKCRVAMTGTPVENRLSELWSIADFAQPGLLGSYSGFRKEYELPISSSIGAEREALTDSLVEKLSPVFLRRTKEEALKGKLPEKLEDDIRIPIDPASYSMYCSIIDEVQEKKENGEKGMQLAAIQKLIMLCSHPRLIAGGSLGKFDADQLIQESPKLKWTVDKLKEIFARGEKVILFTKYREMQGILRYVINKKFGIDASIINGEVTGNRLLIVKAFSNTKGAGAIILSPRAAGVGLTITAANNVIHYTREWNPAVENQATDRAYRIGQKKAVNVYYPIITSSKFTTADDRLAELLESKRELMKSVVIPTNLDIKVEEFGNICSIE